MELSAIIKQYRQDNNLTMEEFSKRADLSKGYISMLEKNLNPKTKQCITPTFQTFKALSKAMEINVNTLINLMDDNQPISLLNNTNQELDIIIEKYNILNNLGKEKAKEYITDLSEQEKYTK